LDSIYTVFTLVSFSRFRPTIKQAAKPIDHVRMIPRNPAGIGIFSVLGAAVRAGDSEALERKFES
jgi:hypothetical protein